MNKFHAYRLALALNNLGVALAEKGHPAEALKTFETALGITAKILRFHHGGPAFAALVEGAQRTFRKATRQVYHEDNHSDNEDDKVEEEKEEGGDDDQTSNKAPLGTKTAATSRRYSSSRDHQHQRRCNPVCQVFTVDDDDLDALQSAALYGPSASVIFLIRIKSCDSICAANDLGGNLTIFLHNLGATYSALARKERGRSYHTTKKTPERAAQKSKSSCSELQTTNKKAADRAHKFLSLARHGLTNLLLARSSSNSHDEDSPRLDLSTGLKTVIVLNALAGLHRTRQNVQGAQHVELEATQLLNVVASDSSFHSVSERYVAAAAA